jgi:hypothetical protein
MMRTDQLMQAAVMLLFGSAVLPSPIAPLFGEASDLQTDPDCQQTVTQIVQK